MKSRAGEGDGRGRGEKVGWAGGCRRPDKARGVGHVWGGAHLVAHHVAPAAGVHPSPARPHAKRSRPSQVARRDRAAIVATATLQLVRESVGVVCFGLRLRRGKAYVMIGAGGVAIISSSWAGRKATAGWPGRPCSVVLAQLPAEAIEAFLGCCNERG